MSGTRGRKRQRRVHLENVLNELTRDGTGAFATEFSIDNHTSSMFDIYYTSMIGKNSIFMTRTAFTDGHLVKHSKCRKFAQLISCCFTLKCIQHD